MKKKSLSIPVIVCCALALSLGAKAQSVLKDADKQYELYNYIKAIELYEQAYKTKESLHAAERLGSSYSLNNNYQQAEHWYAIASAMPGSKPENIFGYAKALQSNSKYAQAKAQYLNYADKNKSVSPEQLNVWTASCDSAISWIKKPKQQFEIKNERALNSIQADWGAVKYKGSVVFTSDRNKAKSDSIGRKPFLKFDGSKIIDQNRYGWTGHNYLKLYHTTESDNIQLLMINGVGPYHIGSASFTANGQTMYFTMTKIPDEPEKMKNKPSLVNVEIYSSIKNTNGTWAEPVPFEYNKVNDYSVGDPFISADGQRLYFASNMPGGKGGTDIYFCAKTVDGKWGKPSNLEQINTFGNERSPVLDLNDNLFFATDGRVGMGGLDIFSALKDTNGFSHISNLGFPLNSPQDDFAFSLNEQGFIQYISSNRNGGLGSDDIYSVKQKPVVVLTLEGRVYDKKLNKPIDAAIVTITTETGNPIKLNTDDNGTYRFKLDTAADYRIYVKKPGYLANTQHLNTKGIRLSTILVKDVYLEQIEVNKAVRLNNIYYDFDSAVILEAAARELDNLAKIMQDNPEIYVELGSHTDSRGKAAYNLKLSQKRAESARLYIIGKGIDPSRIMAKGYGDVQLLNRCVKTAKCSDVEHQVNRRTEFKIVKQ
ncbi:OmpA family protein [Pedobacter rhodius]|uniref:OmpA family protein n=1 Tax=Pedobacter rhodius TaxID=3004098 RepID=A0ABT4KWJ0_9SPHI|nr:OmpA family protein [Pedobacter sp. SJ11]MCZ4222602.1 OmpA family protein [Pedobacter sp. SJ11]